MIIKDLSNTKGENDMEKTNIPSLPDNSSFLNLKGTSTSSFMGYIIMLFLWFTVFVLAQSFLDLVK